VATQTIVILDFGSQYTQLIARRIREQNVFSVVLPCTADLSEIQALQPLGLILSGGPSSVYDADAPAADPKLLDDLSNESRVTPQTPPTFIFSTSEDTTVPSENAVAFYLALHKANVPAELHIFQKGRHGVGLALGDPALGEWPTLLLHWLRGLGLLEK